MGKPGLPLIEMGARRADPDHFRYYSHSGGSVLDER